MRFQCHFIWIRNRIQLFILIDPDSKTNKKFPLKNNAVLIYFFITLVRGGIFFIDHRNNRNFNQFFFIFFIILNFQKLGLIQDPDPWFVWIWIPEKSYGDPTESGSATLTVNFYKYNIFPYVSTWIFLATFECIY